MSDPFGQPEVEAPPAPLWEYNGADGSLTPFTEEDSEAVEARYQQYLADPKRYAVVKKKICRQHLLRLDFPAMYLRPLTQKKGSHKMRRTIAEYCNS